MLAELRQQRPPWPLVTVRGRRRLRSQHSECERLALHRALCKITACIDVDWCVSGVEVKRQDAPAGLLTERAAAKTAHTHVSAEEGPCVPATQISAHTRNRGPDRAQTIHCDSDRAHGADRAGTGTWGAAGDRHALEGGSGAHGLHRDCLAVRKGAVLEAVLGGALWYPDFAAGGLGASTRALRVCYALSGSLLSLGFQCVEIDVPPAIGASILAQPLGNAPLWQTSTRRHGSRRLPHV